MDEIIDGVNAMPEVAAALRRFYLSNPQHSAWMPPRPVGSRHMTS
jgi:hypothetical protein